MRHADAIIVGAGVAGLMTALRAAPARVLVLAKAPVGQGAATAWAQGGIAAAVGGDDEPALHANDTIDASAGICANDVVRLLTREAPDAIRELERYGVKFDRAVDGSFSLGREGAHGRRRILHANGDGTGAEIMRALGAAVRACPTIEALAPAEAEDLIMADGRAVGLVAKIAGRRMALRAGAIVFASGGAGQVYARTTNPVEARGDGLAMAARAGAVIADPEFVQFHPTAIDVGATPMPLATEALRGEGATLVNDKGERFMRAVHPLAELAPRDVVARAIWRQLIRGRRVHLDATGCVGSAFPDRFPTVWGKCREYGVDPRVEGIPVAPAAHYHMGGIAVDEWGRTSIDGLWACGEAACTGAHGANRLASNSLLEGAVFAKRVADSVADEAVAFDEAAPLPDAPGERDAAAHVQKIMYDAAGLARAEEPLIEALGALDRLAGPDLEAGSRNLVAVAKLIAAAALERRESRGGHFRADYPEPSAAYAERTFTTLFETEALIRSVAPMRAVRSAEG